jgi:hypothetical protein
VTGALRSRRSSSSTRPPLRARTAIAAPGVRSARPAGRIPRILAILAAAFALTSCARPPPPLDSVALQARAAEASRAFSAKVAAEPPSPRLAVERVAPGILIAPKESLVYLIDPEVVAVDAITGAERWRARDVRASALGRAGRYLVATVEPSPEPAPAGAGGPPAPRATLAWIDPRAPEKHAICTVIPPVPHGAEQVEIVPFDRAGALYLHWRSSLSVHQGGTPSRPDEEERKAAAGCGVLAIDVATCGIRPASVPGDDASECSTNSLTLVIPAVAASAAPAYAGTRPALHVDSQGQHIGCEERTTRVLRATDGERVLWTRRLPDEVSFCGRP